MAQPEPQGDPDVEPVPGGAWGPAAEEAEEEEGALDCVICFSPYDRLFKVPKALACGHTFCLECLARLSVASEQGRALRCPVCREPTHLPARKGLPGLPTRRDLLARLPLAPHGPGSVRFSRRRGLLYVPGWGPRKGRGPALPKLGAGLNTVSLSVDVGRPAPRGLGRGVRGLGCSSWPFAMAVAVALTLTVGLVISGVYIFLLLPSASRPGLGLGNYSWPLPNGTSASLVDRRLLTEPPRAARLGPSGDEDHELRGPYPEPPQELRQGPAGGHKPMPPRGPSSPTPKGLTPVSWGSGGRQPQP
ncbi:RING finger protein 225-like [Carettochelys insculpta]|uniref:RING finger protein 225-like n=1 Tax=Carettochelys insculpta TaxID=44489 RepID=UPI003EB78672